MGRTVSSVRIVAAVVALSVASILPSLADRSDDMVLVPGASYQRGTDIQDLPEIQRATGLDSREPLLQEVPAHEITVADFYIDISDVTNRQFAAFVAAAPEWSGARADESLHNGRYLEHWVDGDPPTGLLDHPITFVTWYAATAYCEWAGKRLPTEAEYEWAAQDPGNRAEYPWGDTPPRDDIVNWGQNGIDSTVSVGSYAPNSRGLYDMAGNVWHFTADPWVGPYSDMLADPTAFEAAQDDLRVRRVVRGGSWGANAANLRVRYRDSHRPFDAREMVGFRCARSAGSAARTQTLDE